MIHSSSRWSCGSCKHTNPIFIIECEKCHRPRHPPGSPKLHRSSIGTNDPSRPSPSPTQFMSKYPTVITTDDVKSTTSVIKRSLASEHKPVRSDPLSAVGNQETYKGGNDRNATIYSVQPLVGQLGTTIAPITRSIFPPTLSSRQSPVRSNGRSIVETKMNTSLIDGAGSTTSKTLSDSDKPSIVFIPNLPYEKSNTKLEQMIFSRLKTDHQIEVKKVECHLTLHIGVIHLTNEKDKNHLIKRLQSIVLDPQNDPIVIQFIEELEVRSYLVFDHNTRTTITSEDITRRWQQINSLPLQSIIEVVAIDFPNIFKITSRSLLELLSLTNLDCSTMHDQINQIYFNTDCCFFENLPQDTKAGGIRFAINASIGGHFDPSAMYIQFNKHTLNAIVLTTNAVRKWIYISSLNLDNQYYIKQEQLTSRSSIDVVLHATPKKDLPDQTRIRTEKLQSKEPPTMIKPAIKLSDNPDEMEINGETWYETHMLDWEPELKTFIANPQHLIFRYKWNSENWLKQLKFYAGTLGDKHDKQRRLLRLTVMLNTIGILRKKSYTIITNNIEKEIQLNPPLMKTIVYNHQSKLFKRGETSSSPSAPYPSTSVKVVNEDCLVVYHRLASEKYRPVLMNMANADEPGGGYQRGAAAQEENLFRRSNYYQSLDAELDSSQQSKQYWRTDSGEDKPIEVGQKMYPIDEFGAIYTSSITVFRDTEDKGYALLEQPNYNVCSIASAAYSRPPTKYDRPDRLKNEYAVNTRKKIENFFAIAYQQGHDCLVLSAFGCGAFRNPPKHMAMIFRTVIEQYAGYFKEIYFSIIDDMNTGNSWNPDGNFRPFQAVFNDPTVQRSNREFEVNMISGPFRVIDKPHGKFLIDHVNILDRRPCQHSASCRELNVKEHRQLHSHPPLCPHYDSCDQSTKDDVHSNFFIHRRTSVQKDVEEVRPLNCPDGYYCVHFHDQKHLSAYTHPFRTPCPLTPFACKDHLQYLRMKNDRLSKINPSIEEHCLRYAHVCSHGRQCRDKTDPHMQISIHIPRNLCPNSIQCSRTFDEDHFNSFTHLQTNDIRSACRHLNTECPDRWNRDHLLRYRHITTHHDHKKIVCYSGLNRDINFIRNQRQLLKNLSDYAKAQQWKSIKDTTGEISHWIRTLQPIYRCNKITFESFLAHGHVMSRKYMENLRQPQFVVNAIVQHPAIQKILQNIVHQNNIQEFIRNLVGIEFDSKTAYRYAAMNEQRDRSRLVESSLSSDQINIIQEHSTQIAKTSLRLHAQSMGIGYHSDGLTNTENHVCSILGPNLRHSDGDIFIVFKDEIMFHPDSKFSIRAPVTQGDSDNPYGHRPWLENSETGQDRVESFRRTQLHCSVTDYEYAAALQLMALTGMNRHTMDVSLKQVEDRWMIIEPNEVFQAYLPSLVPLDYIAQVYMPKDLFQSLSSNAQQSAKETFQDRLRITDYTVESNPTYTQDPMRQSYSRYVHEQIRKQIINSTYSRHRGIIVSLPPMNNNITRYIHIPITISQSFEQFNSSRSRPSDDLYIYWQALGGDMILTLTEKLIDCSQDSSTSACLMCYIGDIPLNNDRESDSFIANNQSASHEILIKNGKIKAKSSTFHRGCNIYDYITYCLTIKRNTGEVTLTHAGANSIYNHQKLSYTFQPSELDLSKLEHIQIAARNEIVSVLNFVIRHEPIAEYYPSVDKNFKDAPEPITPSPKTPLLSPMRTPFSDQKSLERSPFAFVPSKVVEIEPVSRSPCSDSIYCLRQYSSEDHNKKYTHPCRFSEACRNRSDHPHLVHIPNPIPQCQWDRNCSELTNPLHRAEFRHTNFPDFLIPCRNHPNCTNKSNEHRIKYSHGETIPSLSIPRFHFLNLILNNFRLVLPSA